MRPGDDPVFLSDRERAALADIAASLSARYPELARRLAPEAVRRRRLLGWSLIILGLVVLLATFSASLPLAAIGLGLTAAGPAFVFGRRATGRRDASAPTRPVTTTYIGIPVRRRGRSPMG